MSGAVMKHRMNQLSCAALRYPSWSVIHQRLSQVVRAFWLLLPSGLCEKARSCNLRGRRYSEKIHPSSGLLYKLRGKAILWQLVPFALLESIQLLSTSVLGFNNAIKWTHRDLPRATLWFHLHTINSQLNNWSFAQRGELSTKVISQCPGAVAHEVG